ncbi:SpoIIE family protein phosphatase [Streptomyces sp. NPDC051219]|uniref:SpoIIE family protein phosphatase n=1 Tax=Streptomyces sp. NPDC051219 TaxID=3155283 RepID=UPI003433B07D
MQSQELTAGCLYGIYDPLTLSFTVARAGLPPPVLAHPDGTTEIADIPAAPPLGGDESTPFATTRLELATGSIIALQTDAFLYADVANARNGQDRLRQILADTERPLDQLRDEAARTVPPTPVGADAILLLVRTHALDDAQVVSWELPPDPATVATARARTRRQLALWDLDDLSFSTELIVSELATNAIRYGAPPLRLRLIKGRTLTCEVTDASAVTPHLRHARASAKAAAVCSSVPRCPSAGAHARAPTARRSGPNRSSRIRPRAGNRHCAAGESS